jgi:hypothetical protein
VTELTYMFKYFTKTVTLICLTFLSFPLAAQADLTTRFSIGPVVSAGHELAKGYLVGLALEPSLITSVNEKMDIGAAGVCNIFINNYNSETRDHLVLYGPLFLLSYKDLEVKKIVLEPQLGLGYTWGQDFITDRPKSSTDRDYFGDRISVLSTRGLYGRLGTSILLTTGIKVILAFNFHRPEVFLKEEAKQFYPHLFSTRLYGSTMEFPSSKMNFDTVLIAFTIGL